MLGSVVLVYEILVKIIKKKENYINNAYHENIIIRVNYFFNIK